MARSALVHVASMERTTGGALNPRDIGQVGEETVQIHTGTTALQIVNIQGITSVAPMLVISVVSLILGVILALAGTTAQLRWKWSTPSVMRDISVWEDVRVDGVLSWEPRGRGTLLTGGVGVVLGRQPRALFF